jgi:hypothetical protein
MKTFLIISFLVVWSMATEQDVWGIGGLVVLSESLAFWSFSISSAFARNLKGGIISNPSDFLCVALRLCL